MESTTGKAVSSSFPHFLPELSDALQRISDTYLEEYDEHKAFTYLIAELFETTDENQFLITDGKQSRGIDFIIKDPPSYVVCHCKCPDLSSLLQEQLIPKYETELVDDLISIIQILEDKTGDYPIKSEIKGLQGDYQRDLTNDKESTNLTAIIAILGELTEPARQYFNNYQQIYNSKGIRLKLIEWINIYNSLHALDTPSDVQFEIQLHFDDEADLLAHSDYCYLLAYAHDFYVAFRDNEWNLFEWNVRYQIHKSPINKRIFSTLSKLKGRKYFHHYNNGILITCKNYKKDIVRKRLTLIGPQIINGCQTVRAICEAYDSLNSKDQEHFREKTRVQVKVIKNTDPDFISDLVITTNDQNPMKPRNLKSNTTEQRIIQRGFRGLPNKWFYKRKDGEFESLASTSSKVRWFRKSDYSSGRNRYRVLDNQELAKDWYAFIGNSDRALRGGVEYFLDEPDGVYNLVFKNIPVPAFWSAFKEVTYLHNKAYFISGTPNPYQFLLAAGIAKYVDSRRVSYYLNREEAIHRGITNGKIFDSSTDKEKDEYLSTDNEYFLNIMSNNMREILIELYSFIICLKYSSCDATTSMQLLSAFPYESDFYSSGFQDPDMIPLNQQGDVLIGPIYGFLRDCLKQYYFENEAEIKAAPRLKSYLAQRSTVNRLRELIVRRDKNIVEFDAPWKILGKTFIDSLPSLNI